MSIFEKYRLWVIPAVFLAVMFWAADRSVAGAETPTEEFPFQPGERLVYELRWEGIPAGYAELAVLPFKKVGGKSSWHFMLSVRTNEFVDLFYKVRDRIESFTDLALVNSVLYLKEQREGRNDRNVTVHFDPVARSAIYSNKGVEQSSIEIMDGTIDPLSSLFFVRKQALSENLEIIKSVTDGKKNVKGVAKVVGREILIIDGMEYDTFIVDPDMKDVSGVFEKSEKSNLRLWITADERRLLVKVKSKVVVGSFTGIMVEASVPR